MIRPGYCACGRPLHYSSDAERRQVERIWEGRFDDIDDIHVTGPEGEYLVQRHYIALHGIRARELEELADRGIIRRVR